jgi:hypothetical protein
LVFLVPFEQRTAVVENSNTPHRPTMASDTKHCFEEAGEVALMIAAWAQSTDARDTNAELVHNSLREFEAVFLRLRQADAVVAVRVVADPYLRLAPSIAALCGVHAPPVVITAMSILRLMLDAEAAADAAEQSVLKDAKTTLVRLLAAPEPDVQVAAAETLFKAAYGVRDATAQLLEGHVITALAKAVEAPSTTPLALYYLLAVIHKLSLHEPRAESAQILRTHHVHQLLVALLGGTHGDSKHATVHGIALHILASLAGELPEMLHPLLNQTFIAAHLVGDLTSEWNEVREGAFLWVAALCRGATADNFYNAFIGQHQAHVVIAEAVACPNMRVASSAAHCLARLLLHAPHHLALPSLLLSNRRVFSSLVHLAHAGDRAADDDDVLGARIMASEVALVLALCAANSARCRQHIASECHARRVEAREVVRAVRRQLDGMHTSIFLHWRIVDGTGVDLSQQTGDVQYDAVNTVEPTSAALGRIFAAQATREDKSAPPSRSASRGESPPPRATTDTEAAWVQAATARAVLRYAVGLLSETTGPLREPSVPSPAGPTPDTMYEKAFQLAIRFAKHYEHRSEAVAVKRDTSEGVRRAPNLWRPNKLKPTQKRTWAAGDVQRLDLFVFDVFADARDLGAALRQVLDAATEHLVYLNCELQQCSIAKLKRRCLLTDLFTEVLPRIVGCVEFLVRVAQAPAEADALQRVMQRSGWTSIDSGNLQQLCRALASLEASQSRD